MRRFSALLFFPILLAPALPALAQGAAPVAATATASGILSPALTSLRQSLAGLRLDKWKAPGPVREETSGNIGSITRDLDGTLPGLLATADAAPLAVSQTLPVFRNVDALYDVLLRVVETADLSAPDSDTDALHRALTQLEDARRSLGDAMESAAVSQENQLASFRAQSHPQQLAAPGTPSTNVVDDGARATPSAAHKRKPAVKPAPTPPSQ